MAKFGSGVCRRNFNVGIVGGALARHRRRRPRVCGPRGAGSSPTGSRKFCSSVAGDRGGPALPRQRIVAAFYQDMTRFPIRYRDVTARRARGSAMAGRAGARAGGRAGGRVGGRGGRLAEIEWRRPGDYGAD